MEKFIKQFETIYHYPFTSDNLKEIHIQSYNADETILTVGDHIAGLYFLISGSYYVTSPESNGKELLLRRSTAPSILGDIEIFQQCTVQSNCRAIETCYFLFVPLSFYEKTLKFDAAFTELLLKELSFKLKTCTTLSRVNALASVSVKLAAYLCTIQSKSVNNDYLTVQNVQHVADLIGTTNRHVNRILKKWADDRIIERTDESIKILDIGKLTSLSENIRYK
ncbi:Crp/Fnr family transcriptional regulator [Paenibacillus sp.]|jgi:CRP-like cAMP-binding protein|uniref:Crp/Fnr family transcriptional regulator n=1 Tax=Paenibacillus sp. TaxID=58172 RepID=UPI002834CA03|nr:Crp/Fnr family transcriptional regulator [Paenibacillus sp.]MDR0270840.1 Crp/Fnr family transcriptional regulator [Paenibacillus sp.]